MKRMHCMTTASRVVVLLSISLFACGEKSPKVPEPVVVPPPVASPAAPAPASPAMTADADFESQLKKALSGAPGLDGAAIDVKVVNGVAHIWGTVRSRADKRKVTELVRSNVGVKSVNDNLVVVAGS